MIGPAIKRKLEERPAVLAILPIGARIEPGKIRVKAVFACTCAWVTLSVTSCPAVTDGLDRFRESHTSYGEFGGGHPHFQPLPAVGSQIALGLPPWESVSSGFRMA
jgi:hypothetical protein